MNMVRRTLFENPDVSDRALYAAAVSLEQSIGNLSLQQFQARYPRHVRRFELGPKPIRGPESSARSDDLPAVERPDLYAPGKDTLIAKAPAASDAIPSGSAGRQDTQPVSGARGVRRRVGSSADNHTAEPDRIERARQISSGSQPEEQSVPDEFASHPESTPLQPWPLRLLPDAADHQPPKRPRIRRTGSGKTAQPAGSATPVASEKDAAASAGSQQIHPSILGTSDSTQNQRTRARSEIRRLLFAWAHELVTAETRGELVAVLARAGAYVDSISNASGLGDGHVRDASDGKLTAASGSVDRDSTGSNVEQRAPRPTIRQRKRIQDYSSGELDALVRWVANDDPQRTDDEVVDAVFSELGFERRGRRISATIRSSLDRVRAHHDLRGNLLTG